MSGVALFARRAPVLLQDLLDERLGRPSTGATRSGRFRSSGTAGLSAWRTVGRPTLWALASRRTPEPRRA